jgi:hypothetical protein
MLPSLLLLSAHFLQYRNDLKTVYVITDHRVVTIIYAGSSWTIRSFLLKDIHHVVNRLEYKDGTGDVVIILKVLQNSHGDYAVKNISFDRIRHARETVVMLKSLREQSYVPQEP